jgi:predicted RNase H-like nuclease
VTRARPQARIVEVHPELSFAAMGDGMPLPSKKSTEGVTARLAALGRAYADLEYVVAEAPPRVAIDDCLDAIAALWSAERWCDGRARTLPEDARTPPFIAV